DVFELNLRHGAVTRMMHEAASRNAGPRVVPGNQQRLAWRKQLTGDGRLTNQ
ncbi:MAG: hypothetical protein QOF07_2662, partial [Bradyrhizobium sp.]|nr:hypothetical protein [Bradyrhizobium sp.]